MSAERSRKEPLPTAVSPGLVVALLARGETTTGGDLSGKALRENGGRRTADEGKNHGEIRLLKRPASWWGASPTDAGYWTAVGGHATQYVVSVLLSAVTPQPRKQHMITSSAHFLATTQAWNRFWKASGIGEVKTGGGPAGPQPRVSYKQSLRPTLLKHEV